MALIAKYKSDTWDEGNSLTRFFECVYECDKCGGSGNVYGEECEACEGYGTIERIG